MALIAEHPDVDAVIYLGIGIQSNQARMMREGRFYPDHGLERIVAYHQRQDERFAEAAHELSVATGKPILVATELAVADPDNRRAGHRASPRPPLLSERWTGRHRTRPLMRYASSARHTTGEPPTTARARDRPRRRRRGRAAGPGPWIVLVRGGVVPALVLRRLRRGRRGRTTATRPQPPVDAGAVVPPTPPALSTRRLRRSAACRRSFTRAQHRCVRGEVSPFLAPLNDRSCGAVSVDGVPIGERNADLAVIPASNQKIPVAAAALEQLGADFRYTTAVVAASAPQGGVIDGDLYLVGGGDPLLSSDWYPASNLELYPVTSPTSLDTLADSVVAAGVTDGHRLGRR